MNLDDKDNSELDEKSFDWSSTNIIRLLREIAFLSILVYLSYSFISGDIGISFGTKALTASEIISILLAFFAILLSAAFYYMSTQQSNLFYHNVHQFTKDTSEILGRLDEQVKNIGGKQTELKDTFEKNYTYNNQNGISHKKEEKLSEELEKKEEDLKQKENSIDQKVDSLIEKLESEEEKEKLRSELEKERAEIKKLKAEMDEKSTLINVVNRVQRHTQRRMMQMDSDEVLELTPTSIFMKLIDDSGENYERDLLTLGYIIKTSEGIKATRNGMKFIHEIKGNIKNKKRNI